MDIARTPWPAVRSAALATHLWSAARYAPAIHAFRVGNAVLLGLYYAELMRTLPGVIGVDGLHEGRYAGALLALDATRLHVLCVAGIGLAAGIAVGAASRICAALLLAQTVMLQRAAFATNTLDDVTIAISLFWLCLLPERPACRERPLEGRTASLCALHLMFVQLDVSLWQALSPHWPGASLGLAYIAVGVLLMAPSAVLRVTAMLAMTALHIALAARASTGLGLAHAVLATTPLLMCGAVSASADAAPSDTPWNFSSVLGATALALTLLWRAALAFEVPQQAIATQRLLGALGVSPVAAPRYAASEPALAVRGEDGALHELATVDNVRARRLLAQLLGNAAEGAMLREHVSRALIKRACRDGATTTGTLLVRDGALRKGLAWFDCARGANDDRERVVMLDEGARAP